MKIDMEIYCDYDALKLTDDRKGYAKMLVMAAAGKGQHIIGATSLVNEEHQVTKRIKSIVTFKKPRTAVSILAACVLLVSGAAVAAAPVTVGEAMVQKEETESYITIQQAAEFLQRTDLGGDEGGYVFQNIETLDNGVKLSFGKAGEESFWDGMGGRLETESRMTGAEEL